MRSKGFTLIELLAVIVILAIIALIAMPIILNIIEDARYESNKRSVEMYAKAIENAAAQAQLKNKVPTGIYTYKENELKTIVNGTTELKLEYNNEGIECKVIHIAQNGKVGLSGCKVNDSEYIYGEEYYSMDDIKTNEGIPVGFNVTTGKGCDYTTADSTRNDGCQKFHVIADKGDRVDMILNHQLDLGEKDTVAWNSTGLNIDGPGEVLDKLFEATKNWQGTETPEAYMFSQDDWCLEYEPVHYQCTATSNVSYTVEYDGYKARLPFYEELYTIFGNNATYDWIYENLNDGDIYWTSSVVPESFVTHNHIYGFLPLNHRLYEFDVSTNGGIRPVITVLKSNLK